MTYQMSFFGPSPVNRRREPSRRKGESWQAFCIRHETWRRLTFREKTPEERHRATEQNQQFRENCLRAAEVFCYRQIKASQKEEKPGAVFFWFGGDIGFPGPQSQYLTRATLDFMLAHLGDGIRKDAGSNLRGPVNIFGPCLRQEQLQ